MERNALLYPRVDWLPFVFLTQADLLQGVPGLEVRFDVWENAIKFDILPVLYENNQTVTPMLLPILHTLVENLENLFVYPIPERVD